MIIKIKIIIIIVIKIIIIMIKMIVEWKGDRPRTWKKRKHGSGKLSRDTPNVIGPQ